MRLLKQIFFGSVMVTAMTVAAVAQKEDPKKPPPKPKPPVIKPGEGKKPKAEPTPKKPNDNDFAIWKSENSDTLDTA